MVAKKVSSSETSTAGQTAANWVVSMVEETAGRTVGSKVAMTVVLVHGLRKTGPKWVAPTVSELNWA